MIMTEFTGSRYRNQSEPVGTGDRFPVPRYREPEPEPVAGTSQTREPVILVSSRENVNCPHVTGAQRLAGLARSHGWAARLTYAVALIPDQRYLNGNLARAAHQLATVVVRLRRGPDRGWVTWRREDEGPWRFDHAFVGTQRYGWSVAPASKLPSILERIKV